MKKMLFDLLTMIVVVFAMVSCSSELEDFSSTESLFENSPTYGIKYVDQSQAFEAYEEIMNGFGLGMETKSFETVVYPDYYGGCYIDENNKLIVYMVGDTVRARSSLLSLSSNVILIRGDYSFQELNNIMNVIGDFSAKNPYNPIAENIAAVSLMDKQNNILVRLYDCSKEKIDEFKANVVNSSAIYFEKQEEPLQTYETVSPGSSIYCNGSFSLGYRVNKNGTEGFITAAHGVNEGQFILIGSNSSGAQFARCTDWQWDVNIDAAFCESTYYADYSNIIAYTSLPLANSYGNIIAGAYVYKSGHATKSTYGTIQSTNTQTTIQGHTIRDLASATYESTHGDSGGIVYTNNNLYEGNPVGIVHGGDGTISYFSKALNIDIAFGCTLDN